ncbi:nitronate monooxygenase domain-containing protein [Sarocladium implicatum]|nr:nitronate monooxygenase domain-containing protein [Sarocladium implicatum]
MAASTVRASLLQTWFPWVANPMISNGPMIGAACPRLATEITLAGGLGFNKCAVDLTPGSAHLKDLDDNFNESRQLLGSRALDSQGRLRVGAGFLTLHHAFIANFTTTALPILQKHKPAAVWLFAPSTLPASHHKQVIQAIRDGFEDAIRPRVFVQVGNVEAAKEALSDGADVVIAQGIDAGGHQFRKGMGVVSLVPEVRDAVDGLEREVAVMAAGGIVCGKGVAAAMSLGADGVVMGTRFAVCPESVYDDHKKATILATSCGGTNTIKSPFNDHIGQNPLWGELYDGRAVVTPITEKFLAGASLEECLRILKNKHSKEEAAKQVGVWCGTGVGRVNESKPAAEVVKEVREGALQRIKALAERF